MYDIPNIKDMKSTATKCRDAVTDKEFKELLQEINNTATKGFYSVEYSPTFFPEMWSMCRTHLSDYNISQHIGRISERPFVAINWEPKTGISDYE